MKIKHTLALAISSASLSLLAPNAQAALISGVTASTNMATGNGSLANTVDGAGLPGNVPSLNGLHALASSSNAWLSSNPFGDITFNLNGTYNLAGFSFWNLNRNVTSGIKNVTVQTSTDGVNFATVAGAPTQFAIGVSNALQLPEIFSFSPVEASFVRFTVASNWGRAGTGFSEVQFESTPEPTSILGLLVVSGGLLFIQRRKSQ